MDYNVGYLVNFVFVFLIQYVIPIYNIIFLVWIISMWLPIDRSIFVLQFIDHLVNPIYYTLLKIFPPLRLGVMDFSPFYMYLFIAAIDILLRILKDIIFLVLSK